MTVDAEALGREQRRGVEDCRARRRVERSRQTAEGYKIARRPYPLSTTPANIPFCSLSSPSVYKKKEKERKRAIDACIQYIARSRQGTNSPGKSPPSKIHRRRGQSTFRGHVFPRRIGGAGNAITNVFDHILDPGSSKQRVSLARQRRALVTRVAIL